MEGGVDHGDIFISIMYALMPCPLQSWRLTLCLYALIPYTLGQIGDPLSWST